MAFQLPMPCKNISDCFPCNDIPTTNTSSEGADVIQDFAFQWGNPQTNQPPLGSPFSSNGCLFVCASSISQEDAFLCAQRQQVACVTNNWRPTPEDPPVCLNFPCAPTTPPPDEPVPTFGNRVAACSTHCQDGAPYTFTVPAGSFVATSQILADRMASSFACREAVLHKLCLNLVSPFQCQDTESTLVFVATGPFLHATNNFWELRSGTLPPGFNFTSAMAGPTLSIPGTPTTAGDYTFTIRVTTPNGDFAERPFTVTVDAITTADPLPDGEPGVAYSQTLTSTIIDGTWTVVDGELPDGLTLASDGTLSGTPTTEDEFTFTVQVGDDDTACEKEFTLTVEAAGFIDGLPDFSFVEDFSDNGFAVGDGNDSLPWLYRDHISKNIDPPLSIYPGPSFGQLLVAGGDELAGGYEFDATFTNEAAFSLDQSVPSIQLIGQNLGDFPDGNENGQSDMNASGNIIWNSFVAGGTTSGYSKLYNYASNTFTDTMEFTGGSSPAANFTVGLFINDSNVVLGEMDYGIAALTAKDPFIWSGGVMTNIQPGIPVVDQFLGNGAINNSGNVAGLMIRNLPSRTRVFTRLSGVSSFLTAYTIDLAHRVGINDSNVVVFDSAAGVVTMWDSINGFQVIPVVGKLGSPATGQSVLKMPIISDDGVLIGTRAAGGWVFKNGVVHNIIDLLPVGHGWTSITEGWAISKTGNFVLGIGVKAALSQFFVAKLSFP